MFLVEGYKMAQLPWPFVQVSCNLRQLQHHFYISSNQSKSYLTLWLELMQK